MISTEIESFMTPSVNWWILLPVVLVLGGAVVGVLIEAFFPARARRSVNAAWCGLVLLVALFVTIFQWPEVQAQPVVTGEYVADTLALTLQMVLLVVGLLALLIFYDRTDQGDGDFAAQPADRPGSGEESLSIAKNYQRSEYFPLMLFSLGGMMIFPATDSLLTLFVALEVMSLPLYILAATARRHRAQSQEAGLKYFLLGAFSSGFFLMGAALLFGYSGGSLRYGQIAAAVPVLNNMEWILVTGVFFVMIGLLFKVAAVPFHAWAPDVYTGAPTPVTGFMAAGVKIAAFGAMLRFYQVVAGTLQWDFRLLFGIIAAFTIILGTVVGLVQKNVKRLLAYSSIAHAGFLLIGVLALTPDSAGNVVFYVLSYGVATVGAFGVVTLVRTKDANGNIGGEATNLEAWRGLGRKSPITAVAMLIFLLSFAGIPLTSGFVSKFVVFASGISGGLGWLVGIALGASAITAAFYFGVVARIFFQAPSGDSVVVQSEGYSAVAIAVAAIITVVLGIFPGPVLAMAQQAVVFVP